MTESFRICIKTFPYAQNVRRDFYEKPTKFDVYHKEFQFVITNVLHRELFFKMLAKQLVDELAESPEQIIAECVTFDEDDDRKILGRCYAYCNFENDEIVNPIWFNLTDTKRLEVLNGDHNDWEPHEIKMLARWCNHYEKHVDTSMVELEPEIIDIAKEGPLKTKVNQYTKNK